MSGIARRKADHIEISLKENVESESPSGFEDIHLVHRSLPEIDLEDVSTETRLFGKHLSAPLLISAITGGTPKAAEINRVLARVAEEKQIGLCLGSQRIAIVKPETEYSFKVAREEAPSTLIMGNLGCPQLSMGWGIAEARRCVEMVEADALAVHMNPLQEAVQIGGDTKYRGVLEGLRALSLELEVPLVLKETGAGVSWEVAVEIQEAGAQGLEVSGLGGTSWSAVEHHIAKQANLKRMEYLGRSFWNWGIPTAVSLVEAAEKTSLTLISSGGVRSGVDIAKSLALGAFAGGMARPFLAKALEGEQALSEFVEDIIQEIRLAMFLTGCQRVEELRRVPVVILGRTAEWLERRGISPGRYARRLGE